MGSAPRLTFLCKKTCISGCDIAHTGSQASQPLRNRRTCGVARFEVICLYLRYMHPYTYIFDLVPDSRAGLYAIILIFYKRAGPGEPGEKSLDSGLYIPTVKSQHIRTWLNPLYMAIHSHISILPVTCIKTIFCGNYGTWLASQFSEPCFR